MSRMIDPGLVVKAVAKATGLQAPKIINYSGPRGSFEHEVRGLTIHLMKMHASVPTMRIAKYMLRSEWTMRETIDRQMVRYEGDAGYKELYDRIAAELPAGPVKPKPHLPAKWRPGRFKKPELKTDAPKKRHCLMCRTEFMSSWPGERVCGPCKSTSTWQSGVA